MMYIVEVMETDKEAPDYGEWNSIAIEMCRPSRHCGCYDKGKLDDCDHMFFETEHLDIAQYKAEQLEKSGAVVRIRNNKYNLN